MTNGWVSDFEQLLRNTKGKFRIWIAY